MTKNQNGRAAIRNLIFSGTVDIFLLFKFVSRLPSVRLACRKTAFRLSGRLGWSVTRTRAFGGDAFFSFYFRLRSVPETWEGPRSLIAERERTRGGRNTRTPHAMWANFTPVNVGMSRRREAWKTRRRSRLEKRFAFPRFPQPRRRRTSGYISNVSTDNPRVTFSNGLTREGSKLLSKGGQPLPTASLQPLPMPMLKPNPI